MATHSLSHSFDRPSTDDDIGARVAEFYRENGYSLVDDSEESADTGREAASSRVMHFRRGEEGAGWWTSNMTELLVDVTVELTDDRVSLNYEVDVSGQHLTDSDVAYWDKEVERANDYVESPTETVPDLRVVEDHRAERITGDLRSYGLWLGVLAFLAVIALQCTGLL